MIQITYIIQIISTIRKSLKSLNELFMLFSNAILKKNISIKIFITKCTLFIVYWTKNRNKTYILNKEIMFKYNNNKPIIKSFCSL